MCYETNLASHNLSFGSLLNDLRKHQYNLSPVPWIRLLANPLPPLIPHINLWSTSLLQKPISWPANAQVVGFTSSPPLAPYVPPPSLERFFTENSKPLLAISLGSMHISNPTTLLSTLSSALEQVHASVVVNRSWEAELETHASVSPDILITDYIPHAWLLPRVAAFIHHGGAGHTAAGLRAGIPMLLIPFLLDQFFWSAKVHELGLGPPALRFWDLTEKRLVQRLELLLSSRYNDACEKMASRIRMEKDGAEFIADVVKRELEGIERKCDIFEDLGAIWKYGKSEIEISGAAAAGLVSNGILRWDDLDLLPKIDWEARWRDTTPQLERILMVGKIFTFSTWSWTSFMPSFSCSSCLKRVGDCRKRLKQPPRCAIQSGEPGLFKRSLTGSSSGRISGSNGPWTSMRN